MELLKNSIKVILFFSLTCSAQKTEYLVTNKNDTIYGNKISIKRKNILTDGKNKIEFNLDTISGYYLSKNNYYFERVISPHSRNKNRASIYLIKLTEGRIKLYLYFDGYGTDFQKELYISKNNSELKKIPIGRIKFGLKSTYEEIRPFIEDDSLTVSKLESIDPKKDAFVNLINEYNKRF